MGSYEFQVPHSGKYSNLCCHQVVGELSLKCARQHLIDAGLKIDFEEGRSLVQVEDVMGSFDCIKAGVDIADTVIVSKLLSKAHHYSCQQL